MESYGIVRGFSRVSCRSDLEFLFDEQNDSGSKMEIMVELTGSEIWYVVQLCA